MVFVACSSSRIDRKFDDVAFDSLAEESYLRWGKKRLESSANPAHKVVNCYQGKVDETLAAFKREYVNKSDSPYYWLHIGNCYFIKESWNKAEFFYRLSLEEAKSKVVKSIALNNLG